MSNNSKRWAKKVGKTQNNNNNNNNRHDDDDGDSYNGSGNTTKSMSIYENLQHLSFREKEAFEKKFSRPKNDAQLIYMNHLDEEKNKIIIATGPAGTGKTLFATEYGIKQFLLGKYEKIIFTRPAVQVDEDLGYLPGTLDEKMGPYIRPIYDILYRYMTPEEVTHHLQHTKQIEISPLAFMRGRTFTNCWIIADEMQNSSISQMKMLLTRLGDNSRIVITGDLEQHDRGTETNGLNDFLEKLRRKRTSSITSVEFGIDDIEREQVVKDVLEIYNIGIEKLDNLLEKTSDKEGEGFNSYSTS